MFTPDLILFNGAIYSADNNLTIYEAIAVKDGQIMALGDSKDICYLSGPDTKLINLKGKSLLPGFNEAHNHMLGYGLFLNQLDARADKVTSIEEIKGLVKEKATTLAKGEWIIGRGFDEMKLAEKRVPTRWDLDEVSPHHPVFLKRTCGHACVINSKACELLGESFFHDCDASVVGVTDGVKNGILKEKAMDKVLQFLPAPNLQECKDALKAANSVYLSYGITSSQDAGIGELGGPESRAFLEVKNSGDLKLRTYLMILAGERRGKNLAETIRETGFFTGFGDVNLRLGAIKVILDGSFGGNTAALKEPYCGTSDHYGVTLYSQDELNGLVWLYHSSGFQIAIHAIGDHAIDMALKAYENAQNKFPLPHVRHRIEHCCLTNHDLLERISAQKIVVVHQPVFIHHFGEASYHKVGNERTRYFYPMKNLLNFGIANAASSDAPVADINPFVGIEAMVERKTANGTVLNAEEKLSLAKAIQSYTAGGAYASYEEHLKGTLEIGKKADFAILSDDIFQVKYEQISSLEVQATVINGEILFDNGLEG